MFWGCSCGDRKGCSGLFIVEEEERERACFKVL